MHLLFQLFGLSLTVDDPLIILLAEIGDKTRAELLPELDLEDVALNCQCLQVSFVQLLRGRRRSSPTTGYLNSRSHLRTVQARTHGLADRFASQVDSLEVVCVTGIPHRVDGIEEPVAEKQLQVVLAEFKAPFDVGIIWMLDCEASVVLA